MRLVTLCFLFFLMTVGYAGIMEGQDYPSKNIMNYQVIIKYIMKNYDQVPLTDALLIAEHTVSVCERNNVDPMLITALISVESGFNKYAVSCANAKGLGQLMPFNLETYNVKNPFDIKQNINGTVTMIKELLTIWNGNVHYTLASYLAGVGAVRSYKSFPNYTSVYISQVLTRYNDVKKLRCSI